jgi:hypothetical protein
VSTFSGIATSIRTSYHIRRTSLPPTGGGGVVLTSTYLCTACCGPETPGCNFMSPKRILVEIFNYSPYYSATVRNCFRG